MLKSPNRPRQRPIRSERSGFALLITITLLAFLVLLLVSLAALTRVETQVATNTQDVSQARQNALFALNVALGELQKSAGPDQRTTAAAALGEAATGITSANASDNGVVTPVNGTRYWTGVWGNKRPPDSIFSSPPEPVLLRWLVSGNENSPAITTAGDGHISAPTAAVVSPFAPSQILTPALTAATGATTPLLINTTTPAVLLLGSHTAGTHVAGYVAAPLVDINASQIPGLSGSARIGRYAWWVGDEGVKAKYNLPDPYISNATADTGASDNSLHSRYRLRSAQRNGIEKMPAFAGANYPVATTDPATALYTGLAKTLTLSAIPLASPAVNSATLRPQSQDMTTHSYGVIADPQFGGLKRDLTFHLDAQSADTFLDGRNILPDGATPVSSYPGSRYTAQPSLFSDASAQGGLGYTTLNVSPRLGPKWDQLKSFYQTAYGHLADLEVQPAVDIDANPVRVQAGITPVILETRFLFALKSGPSIDTSFIVILGNPYSRPLKAAAGLNVRAALHRHSYTNAKQVSQEWGVICNYIGAPPPSPATDRMITSVFTRLQGGLINATDPMQQPPLAAAANPDTKYHPHYYPLLKFAPNPSGEGPPDPHPLPGDPGLLDNVLFQIPPGVLNLAPGEAKAYKLNPATSLPDEIVDGRAFRVKALQEMSDSIPTYFTHLCDNRYVNDSSLFPPGLFTGGPMPSGSEFRVGLNKAANGGMDFILTIPGKPTSVLQSSGPYLMPATPTLSGTPNTRYVTNVFGSSRSSVGGGRGLRAFGNSIGNYHSTGESLMANHADSSLTGSFQSIRRFDTALNSGLRSVLRVATFTLDDTNFTSGLDPSTATQGAWGQSYVGNPARLTPRGKFILNDLPGTSRTDEIPFLSLAQLQHLDLTADDEALGTAAQPAYAVGNSRYYRFVSRAASRSDPQDNNRSLYWSNQDNTSATALGDSPAWYSGFVPDLPKKTQVRRYDLSYLLNAALWDTTYFSTIRPSAGSSSTLAPSPANRRLVFAPASAPTLGQLRGADASSAIPQPAALTPGESGRAPASQLLINGAFNINSTSVDAWIAVLSGLRGLGVHPTPAITDRTPAARSIRQTGGLINDAASNASAVANETTYTGFRSLTDAQIATLAAEIVKQVKARGPFLSLSQFINRHLTAAAALGDPVADSGLAGALQQAIDRSGLNNFLNTGTGIPRATSAFWAAYPDESVMPTGDTSGISTYMGTPGWLNQADLLQALAPSLSARSDTFVIRTYGEALDPVNSPAAPAAPVIKARAWCEAVVQRMPDYVDNTQRPTLHPSLANTQNQTFGRRFHIVSFRWLSPDDI